jgi:DNA-binding beta-propeller fold protein YncE
MTARAVILLGQKNDHSLGYYDLGTGAELRRVALAPFPHEMVLDAPRRHAFLTHFGVALAEDEGPGGNTVSVVDVAAGRVVRAIDCGAWRRPHGIARDGAGRLYVASEGASRLLVIDDPLGGGVTASPPTGGAGSHMVSVTRDGGLAFVSNMGPGTVTVVRPREPDRPPVVIPVGARPEGSAFDRDERFLFAVVREAGSIAVIDVARLEVVDRVTTPPGPVRICAGAGGALLAALYHDRSVVEIDPATRRAGRRVALPGKPVSIGYDAQTGLGFASLLEGGLCVVDLEAGRVARRIATRAAPDPVEVVRIEI